MSQTTTVIWVLGSPGQRLQSGPLLEAIGDRARVVTLGGPGQPSPDLCLPPGADLSLALESCPPALRPQACLWLAEPGATAPADLAGLPCPALGWGGRAPEGRLPDEPRDAASALLAAAARGLDPPWMARVQVNMPLAMLLEKHLAMAARLPINLEVGIDWQALDSLGEEDLEQARRVLRGRRVTGHLPFGDLVPGSPDPKVAAVAARRLNAAAQWALSLGAEQVVMHLGLDSRMHPDPNIYAQRLAGTLTPFARELARGRCRLALENVFEAGPEPLLPAREALAQAGGGRVGFCLDVGHARAFSATALERWLQAEAGHILELHLHDNHGDRDEHLPPGRGLTDWDALGRAVQAMDPAPVLTLEPHCEADLWASLRALERIWGPPWG